jgi:hypothetical protein
MNFPKWLDSEDMSLIIKEWKLVGCFVHVYEDYVYVSHKGDWRYYELIEDLWLGRKTMTVEACPWDERDYYLGFEEEDFFPRARRKTKRDGPDQE